MKKKKKEKPEPKRELKVSAIESGTVIDHIPAESTFEVTEILNLSNYDDIVSVASNLTSRTVGKKGIVKVAGKFLTENEVNKIAVLAPEATLNIIRNYEVKEKTKVKIPATIENVIKCSNPACITNNEEVKTKFSIILKLPLKVKCYYCEKEMSREEIKIV